MTDWTRVEEAASLVEQAKEHLAFCEAPELCLPRIFCETIEHHLARWLVDNDAPACVPEEV
jgi:hypothetical protein